MSEIRKQLSFTARKFVDAEVKALPTAVVEIIPTFGMNKLIVPVNVHVHLKSTGAYTNFDVLAAFALLRGTAGGSIFTMDQMDTLLGSAVDMDANMIEQPIFDAPLDIINKPLNLKVTNALGAFTGGNSANALTVTVAYYVLHV